MARIDLARRAQIGRDRSARTRDELLAAARRLYGERPFDQVTVEDVVAAAGVAKGTFYVHFASLAELQTLVADDLAGEFDELLQPRRVALHDPVERLAAGCGACIEQALRIRRGRSSRIAPPPCPASPASRATGSKKISTAPPKADNWAA